MEDEQHSGVDHITAEVESGLTLSEINTTSVPEINVDGRKENIESGDRTNSNGKMNGNAASYHHVDATATEKHHDSTDKESMEDANRAALVTDHNTEIVLPEEQTVETGDAEDVNEAAGVGISAGKKSRKKRKPKSQRGLANPTGFEEFYVDAPVTPAEYEAEKGMYDISRPFAQRIEKAIQRFYAKRNLGPNRGHVFDRYLIHGGIQAGPKTFSGGLDAETIENSNAQELAALTATHFVDFDKSDPRNNIFTVDFEACLKAYLSSQLPLMVELDSEPKIKDLIGTLRNFFNYLLHHDVCPEYVDQVKACREICDQAVTEFWNIAQVAPLLPGTFNQACSKLFGGSFQKMNTTNEGFDDSASGSPIGITEDQAYQAFKIGFTAYATDTMIATYKSESATQSFRILSTEEASLEVTAIALGSADPETLSLYSSHHAHNLKPLGKLYAQTWHNPTALAEDLTEEEEAELASQPLVLKEYEFWLEDEVLEKCFVGMKLEADVKELSFGVCYFDAVFGVYASFFNVLPNGLMVGWREVEKEWLKPREEGRSAEGSMVGEGGMRCSESRQGEREQGWWDRE